MNKNWKNPYSFAVALILGWVAFNQTAVAQSAKPQIVHDSEYYILEMQHGEQWAAEDQELNKKLAELRKKYETPPNIIHIMWDDTAVGEVGIPSIQKIRGFETPNMNRLAAEGINFMRMYTEPSCTQSRAALLTGRLPIRNGMYNVGFPYEYGGLAASEVTTAEVLSKAGYATAFYGKAHIGDIEASYMTNHGFDEALWAPYNQVPSLYTPQGQWLCLHPPSCSHKCSLRTLTILTQVGVQQDLCSRWKAQRVARYVNGEGQPLTTTTNKTQRCKNGQLNLFERTRRQKNRFT